jgi:hypothetical protein
MKFTVEGVMQDGTEARVEWADGKLTGTAELVAALEETAATYDGVLYWGTLPGLGAFSSHLTNAYAVHAMLVSGNVTVAPLLRLVTRDEGNWPVWDSGVIY